MSLGKQRQWLKWSDSPPKGMGLFCSYDPSLLFSSKALLIRRDWETLLKRTPSPATATPSNSFGNNIWKLRSETLSFLQILFTICQFIHMLNCQCIPCNCFRKMSPLRIPEQNVFSHSAPPHFLVNSVLLLSVGLVLFSSITLRSSLSRYKTKSGHVTFLLSFRTIFSLLSFCICTLWISLYFYSLSHNHFYLCG